MATWISAGKGVRYREHEIRKHKGQPDRYYTLRVKVDGKLVEEGLGWQSQGMNLQKALIEREKLRHACRVGEGPTTLKEKRGLAREKRQEKAEEEERQKRESLTFGELMEGHYLPWSRVNKKHWKDDVNRHKVHLAEPLGIKSSEGHNPLHAGRRQETAARKGTGRGHYQARLGKSSAKHTIKPFFGAGTTGRTRSRGSSSLKAEQCSGKGSQVLEEERLLMAALKAKSWRQVHDMAMLSLYAGLRFGEVAAMRWGDIDENHRLHVRGKGGKVRKVRLAPRLQEILTARRPAGASPADLVFPDRKNGGVMERISATYYRTIDELGLNAGRERKFCLDFHSLRHTFATRLAVKGTPLNVLRDLLGHVDLKMVSRYSHEAPSVADEAIRSLDQESRENTGNGAAVIPLISK